MIGAGKSCVLAGKGFRLGLALLTCVSLVASGQIPPPESPVPPPPSNAREFYNAGTEKLREGKLREAEAFLQSALAIQDQHLQPPTLYNLGHVRFAQGVEELKKGPQARPVLRRAETAAPAADEAIQQADEALGGTDMQKLIAAYLRGRGARRELKAAAKAVRQALDTYGTTLSKWQRSSGDFKSALELNQHDSAARQNADIVDRSIAKLVDTLRRLQQAAAALGDKKQELGEKLKQLRGKIPDDLMPPGAAGDDDEDEDLPNGPRPEDKEAPGKEGEQQMTLSPEQAGWMLEGYKLDNERRLPMGQENTAEPRNRSGKTW